MEANKEAAADALARARQKYAAADDAGALQWAEKSLKLYRTAEAAKLQQEIREFGDGSENAALVRRVLASRDHFEALSALPGETELARGPHFDGAEASKRWKRLSKALHPDKNRARDADEAQKRVNLANDVLKDAAARHKYELTLPPRTRGGSGRRPDRRRTPAAPPQYSRDCTANRARERRRPRRREPPRRTSARAARTRGARRPTRTRIRTVGAAASPRRAIGATDAEAAAVGAGDGARGRGLHAEEIARLKEELAAARRHERGAARGGLCGGARRRERDAAGARCASAPSQRTELTRVDAEGGRLRREIAASERARREAEEEAAKLRRYFEAKDGPGAPLQAGGSAKKRPRSAAEAGPSEPYVGEEEDDDDDEADLLVLEPIDRGPPAVDCRKPIQVPLPADDDASLTMGRTKHQDKGKDADFGIEDVRVSRNHIRVARKVGGAPTLTVLAPTNPVAYCEANSNERQLLTKGQVCELADGDQVRLVVEDHVKAEGNSEKFAGNPCAYQVHLYRRGVRLSAERRAAAKRVRRSSGRLAQSPRNQHWPR